MKRKLFHKRRFRAGRFEETMDAVSNPGCGWYHLYTFDAVDANAPLYIACPEEELVLLRISVGNCRERELTESELKNISRILQFFRNERKGMILRFAYDLEGHGMEREPVAVSLVQKHMQQIGKIVQRFAEDVLAVQGILVGNWGEMHGSKFLSEKYLTKLARTMLEALGENCFLAVRTPRQYDRIMESLDEIQRSQLALFNDGIFGSATDLGTYGVGRDRKEEEQLRDSALQWQSQQLQYRMNGGEVLAGGNSERDRLRWKDANSAFGDLARMHISYLNSTYQQEILQAWKEQEMLWPGTDKKISGYECIGRHLGYRFVLRDVSVDKKNKMHILIENCGFAELCEKADAYLIWQQGENEVWQAIAADARHWKSGAQTELSVPFSLPEEFSDTEDSTCYLCLRRHRDGRYLRFANAGADEKVLLGVAESVDH